MNELNILQLIYAVSILIVAIGQSLVPRFSGKGLHLGVRFSERNAERSEIDDVINRFNWLTLGLGVALAVLVFFLTPLFARSIVLQLFVLLLAIVLLTLPLIWGNKKLKDLKAEWNDPGPRIIPENLKREILGKEFGLIANGLWLHSVAFLIFIACTAYTLTNYDKLPEIMPTHFNFKGQANAFSPKSHSMALLPASSALVLWIIIYLSNLAYLSGKQSLDVRDPEGSLKRYLQARNIWTVFMGLANVVFVGFTQIGITYLFFGNVEYAQLVIVGLLLLSLILVITAIYLAANVGTFGERMEDAGIMSDDSTDDNWKLGGLIYYNKADSAVFAQKRIGAGVTINLATAAGKLIVLALMVLIILPLILLI